MAIKQRPDSPTNNFATLNPLNQSNSALSNGNLQITQSADPARCFATMGMTSGKWYWEATIVSGASYQIGIHKSDAVVSSGNGYGYYGINGYKIPMSGAGSGSSYGDTFTVGDTVGVAYDGDNGSLYFYKNGVAQNSGTAAFTGLNDGTVWIPFLYLDNYGTVPAVVTNFGQDPTFGGTKTPSGGTNSDGSYPDKSISGIGGFFYDPPAGAKALCTANLPEMTPSIDGDTPQDYFKAVTYTGNGTGQSITGVGFRPDLIWAKSRSSATSHALADSVRGPQKILSSNSNVDEYSETSGKTLLSFDSDGFTVGTDGNYTAFTANNSSIVAWCFRAGGAPTTDNTATSGAMNANGSAATSSNSSVSLNGTLQSNYTPAGSPTIYPKRMSINTDAGFSIVKYVSPDPAITNPSVPHGLNKAPDFVIIKPTSTVAHWIVKHVGFNSNADNTLRLDTTDQVYADSYNWGGNHVTNTVVPLGNYSNSNTNKPSSTHIMYCWHSVEGFSKFGYVSGLNNDEYVYLGFRPSWVMLKRTSTTSNWSIYDNARNPHNVCDKTLNADTSNSENTYASLDLLSNGFKARSLTGVSGGWIYMAFAEQPFNYANAR